MQQINQYNLNNNNGITNTGFVGGDISTNTYRIDEHGEKILVSSTVMSGNSNTRSKPKRGRAEWPPKFNCTYLRDLTPTEAPTNSIIKDLWNATLATLVENSIAWKLNTHFGLEADFGIGRRDGVDRIQYAIKCRALQYERSNDQRYRILTALDEIAQMIVKFALDEPAFALMHEKLKVKVEQHDAAKGKELTKKTDTAIDVESWINDCNLQKYTSINGDPLSDVLVEVGLETISELEYLDAEMLNPYYKPMQVKRILRSAKHYIEDHPELFSSQTAKGAGN